MTISRFVRVAAFVLCLPVVALAADEAPLRLSLEECVARALERNLDIAIARLDPASARENVTIAEAQFDSSLSANLSHTDVQQEPTSTFSMTKQTVDQTGVTYTDPLLTGGQWTASMKYNERDSAFPPGSAAAFGLVPLNVGASLTLSISQPLMRNYGLKINRTGIDRAMNNLQVSEAQLADRVMQIVEQVEAAYWDLVGAQQGLAVAERSLRLAEDFLRQTKIKVEVGTLPPIEITTAEAEVATRDVSKILQENAVRDAEDTLRALMRVPPRSADWGRDIAPTDKPVFSETTPDTDIAIAEALERRSSVIQAKLALKNAELSERWRRNQLRWDLRVEGSFTTDGNNFEYLPRTVTQTVETIDWNGPDGIFNSGDVSLVTTQVERERLVREDGSRGDAFSELPKLDNTNWTVGLRLGIPLGNRVAKAEHTRSRLALDQAGLQVDVAMQAVSVEVRRAVRSVQTNARRVKSADLNVIKQEKKTDAEQKRYENGLSTAYQVLQFQRDFLAAEADRISAVIDYMKALSHLERVKASLLEARHITLE